MSRNAFVALGASQMTLGPRPPPRPPAGHPATYSPGPPATIKLPAGQLLCGAGFSASEFPVALEVWLAKPARAVEPPPTRDERGMPVRALPAGYVAPPAMGRAHYLFVGGVRLFPDGAVEFVVPASFHNEPLELVVTRMDGVG